MKNFVLTLLLIAALSFGLQLFLPWWIIAVVAFIAGYLFKQNGFSAFFAGFLAIFLLWAGYAFVLSSANNHLLAGKIAELLKPLTGGKTSVLFILTGTLGGLVSGFACLSGNAVRGLQD